MTFLRVYKTYLTGAAIIWIVSLVLSLLAYMIVLRPQNNSKKRLESNLAEQKQLYASAQRAAQEETRIQLNEQIERLRDQLNNFAIDSEELTDLTFDISQIANRENLASFSVTTNSKKGASRSSAAAKKDSETNHIGENFIDIKFTAGFHQFAIFVNALERHRPVLFIDEFKINRSTKDDSSYQAILDVAAFVKKKQNNETADTASTSTFSTKL
jgi:Tfp pilus assembly protein PilO